MGPRVTSILPLPRNSDGTLVDTRENEDLCSNLRASKKPKSPPNDSASKNQDQGKGASSDTRGKGE